MSLNKDVSLRVDVTDELQDLKLTFKTVGDKIHIQSNIPGLYEPKEVLEALNSCIAFQDKLKKEQEVNDGNSVCSNVQCVCEQPCESC